MILLRIISMIVTIGAAVMLSGVPSVSAQVTLSASQSMDEIGIEAAKAGDEIVGVKVRDAWCPRGAICSSDAATGTSGLVRWLLTMAGIVLKFVGIVAVIVIVIGGVRLVISHGNDEEVGNAHKHILWAVLGLLVIMLALVVVQNVTRVIYDTTGAADAAKHEKDAPTISACEAALDGALTSDPARGAEALTQKCAVAELAELETKYFRTLACQTADVSMAVTRGRVPGAVMMARVCTPDSLATLQKSLEK